MPAQLGLVGVDHVEGRVERRPQLALEGDERREAGRRDVQPEAARVDRGVERAAVADVAADLTAPGLDRHVSGEDEGRHVPEADRLHVTAVGVDPGDTREPARRDVDRHGRLGPRDREPAGFEGPGHQRDRPVAARRRVTLVVEEHDAEVGAGVVGLGDEAAVHVGVAARLVDEQATDPVEDLAGEPATLEHGRALERPDAAGHDPERLAARVVVDRRDVERDLVVAHGRPSDRWRSSRAWSRSRIAGHSSSTML